MSKISVYKLVTIILLFLISFFLRFIALNQTPFANGWDGYYYIMQMYTFIEKGGMRAPDFSIIYPYFIGISYLLRNHILAYKIGCALLAGIFTTTAYFLSMQLVDNESDNKYYFSIPLFVAAFSIFSPTLTYFSAQFPKNLLGVIFLLWFIYFIHKKNIYGIILFFILAFITHRLTAGLAAILFIISVIHGRKLVLLIPGGIFAGAVIIFLPGIIHYSDIQRFTGNLAFHFPLYEFIHFFGISKLSIFWLVELILMFSLFCLFIIVLIYRFLKHIESSKIYFYLLIVLIILSFPVLPFTQASFGFRFYLVFNLLAIFLVPFFLENILSSKLIIAGSFMLIFLGIFSFKSYAPKEQDPPYPTYFQVVDKLEQQCPDSSVLIIAHQGLAQIIITYTNYEATNWQPVEAKKYQHIWRIAADIPYYYYRKYLNDNELMSVKPLYHDYYLMPEIVWQEFKARVNESQNSSLKVKIKAWYNPSEIKPDYLLKGRDKNYLH